MRSAHHVFFLGFVTASFAFSATTPRESLLVLSKADHTLVIVDPSTLKVVAKPPIL